MTLMGELKHEALTRLARVVLAHESPFTLGTLRINPAMRQVGSADRSEILEPRVMQVLVALARAGGAIVTRDELIERCWNGRIVTDDAITRPLSQIRQIAADIGEGSFGIQTITKVGYRLLAKRNDGAESDIGVPLAGARLSRRSAVAGGIGFAGIAAVGIGGWSLLKPRPIIGKRIAVLPFADLSAAGDQTYFAEGITEELRSALSRIGMEVIGRSSSVSVKDLDTRMAAKRLGVANILTGSVRRSPEVIRVDAQLVSGTDGVERWAQSYDRAPGDAIRIQTDIAANVALALDIVLDKAGHVALTLGGTADSVAQDLVLRARDMRRAGVAAEHLQKSLALIEGAIARDANYALAHVEKSTVLIILAMNFSTSAEQTNDRIKLAERAANRALVIAPAMGLAHLAQFNVEEARLNFALALQHFRRAEALAPDDLDVVGLAPGVLVLLGQGEEALRLADRFITLDPLNFRAYLAKSWVLLVLGQFPKALEAARKALKMNPGETSLNGAIGHCLLLMGRLAEAQAAFRLMPGNDIMHVWLEALLATRKGNAPGAEKWASELWKRGGTGSYVQQAEIHAQLGQKERALAELKKAFGYRDNALMGIRWDPWLDPLRGDSRFADLVSKLNFPG